MNLLLQFLCSKSDIYPITSFVFDKISLGCNRQLLCEIEQIFARSSYSTQSLITWPQPYYMNAFQWHSNLSENHALRFVES